MSHVLQVDAEKNLNYVMTSTIKSVRIIHSALMDSSVVQSMKGVLRQHVAVIPEQEISYVLRIANLTLDFAFRVLLKDVR